MRRMMSDLTRQIVAAAILSAVAVLAMVAAASSSRAADMPESYRQHHGAKIHACGQPQESVMLFDTQGRPTIAGRTEYYYCITASTLLPGDIPPPPEYCCG